MTRDMEEVIEDVKDHGAERGSKAYRLIHVGSGSRLRTEHDSDYVRARLGTKGFLEGAI